MVALLNTPELPRNTVICGDCLDVLREMAGCSVDAIVTDPPYGLGEVKDITKLLQSWMNGEDGKEYANKKGFMSKDWDVVPSPLVWKECFRVLRPGGFLLAFAGTRTWDLMSISIRLAGFEDRDTIAHNGPSALQWLYGSGFPKSTAIDKQIDKHLKAEREVVAINEDAKRRACKNNFEQFSSINPSQSGINSPKFAEHAGEITAPATPEAKKWQGWGSALKPSWEPVLMFRKPLSEPTIAQNVLVHGTGGLNIDATRIAGTVPQVTQGISQRASDSQAIYGSGKDLRKEPTLSQPHNLGRFPSNTLFSHTLLCRQTGVKRVRPGNGSGIARRQNGVSTQAEGWGNIGKWKPESPDMGYTDPDGMEIVDAWECDPSCPVRLLGEQSGVRSKSIQGSTGGKSQMFGVNARQRDNGYGDEGTVARYFQQFSPSPDELEAPFYYCSKASKSERNKGCEDLKAQQGFDKNTSKMIAHVNHETGKTTYNEYKPSVNGNHHPTVKPLSLLKYLITLISPPGGIVLDMFAGSGSTGVAAIQTGHPFILVEQSLEYVEIARARIAHAMQEAGIAEVQGDGEWICSDDCPVRILGEQSGVRKSGSGEKHPKQKSTFMASTNYEPYKGTSIGGDTGTAARFFAQFAPDSLWSGIEKEGEL